MTHVRVHVEAPVITLTLNRPERRNAQTPGTWRTLAEIGRTLPDDVRFVVIDAEGPSFSAGLDLAMMTPDGADGERSMLTLITEETAALDQFIQEAQAGFTWLQDAPVITVAAVHGHAIGAGMQLALACDLIFASPDAQFAMRETSLGLVPDLAGTKPLVERVGYSRALEICATGRLVSAEEALAIGLINGIAPDPKARAAEWIGAAAASPAGALSALKPLLRSAIDATPDVQRQAERAAQVIRLHSLQS